MNLNTLSQNRGFTLIEILVTFVISLLIILGASFSFKTIILGWNKTEKIYNDIQKYTYITRLLNKNLSSLKFGGKYFFKGNENFVVFFTEKSGLHLPGLFEIGYYFENNNLNICYNEIKNNEDILDAFVLKGSSNCFSFENIKDFKLKFGLKNEYQEIEFFSKIYRKPKYIKLNLDTDFLNEEIIFEL